VQIVYKSGQPASDADMLRHLISAKAVSQAEIHQATGISKSTISEVLDLGESGSVAGLAPVCGGYLPAPRLAISLLE
jgi:hypothetical protein